ncbi:alpha/beta hydrolase [Micromonospora sp. WMMD1102]|uniref:alpha/beta hydrolase n=1 Tax=Micromonospora sp. WMMD1102 TaxID=3016105 RepID=UPI0024157A96|nr:alpha/beta hydrolase [Micromonospora sp. WMMD1102]MDG4788019.1 alpha/beta hydrolase [Micromonospora sp. WMMD1102]
MPEARRATSVVVHRELLYRTVPGFRPLALDLHVPEGVTDPPLVVYVHGGAFREGHRAWLPPVLADADIFDWLPRQGFAVASVDYRLSGEALWPACVDDVLAALHWLRDSVAGFGVDPTRVAVWGESAGGYLAVMAGLVTADLARPDSPGPLASPPARGRGGPDGEAETAPAAPVRGIVDWYGPTDFATMAAQGAPWTDEPDSPESQLLGAPVQSVPELARRASPCTWVTAASPPLLVMHGTADQLVPFGQARQLARAYSDAGAHVELIAVPGGTHVFDGTPAEQVTEPVLSFLRSVLG